MLKVTTKDDQLKELQYKTEKLDKDKILKSLKIDSESLRKKYKSWKEKKILLFIFESLIGSGFAIKTSILSIPNPSSGVVLVSSKALLTAIAILITHEYISKLESLHTKLQDWINVISLFFFGKTSKQSMIDKKIDEKKSDEI